MRGVLPQFICTANTVELPNMLVPGRLSCLHRNATRDSRWFPHGFASTAARLYCRWSTFTPHAEQQADPLRRPPSEPLALTTKRAPSADHQVHPGSRGLRQLLDIAGRNSRAAPAVSTIIPRRLPTRTNNTCPRHQCHGGTIMKITHIAQMERRSSLSKLHPLAAQRRAR